jgi:hypothetical protein
MNQLLIRSVTVGMFLLLLGGCKPSKIESPESTDPDSQVVEFDQEITALLELGNSERELPAFTKALESLAAKQDWENQLSECRKRAMDWDEGRAFSVPEGHEQYVVVILKGWDHTIPGKDTQSLILLDSQGRYRDQLSCDINNRLTRMHFGRFQTVLPKEPEHDGARLVIQLDGESARGNFSHQIHHDAKELDYYWGENGLDNDQPTKWETQGLCRVAIRDGEFVVLFPTEAQSRNRR